jgi:hypothetical protein
MVVIFNGYDKPALQMSWLCYNELYEVGDGVVKI